MSNTPPDEFLNPSPKQHYDLYPIRKLLLQTLTAQLSYLKGNLVDVGCGKMPYRSFILQNSGVTKYTGIDWAGSPYHATNAPDLFWDGKTLPVSDLSADCCMATEVFEHLPNAPEVAREINRILKPDGILFLTVPFFWPFHEVPFDEYRYTPFSLTRILKEAGFEENKISIGATGGWFATLAQVIAQVICMEVKSPRVRGLLKRISIPFIDWLLKNDKPPVKFTNHSMALGLYVIARK